tara:strand:- start:993 stop:1184 length:192 start_codon:yes stop_codon:yes gene_type:complete
MTHPSSLSVLVVVEYHRDNAGRVFGSRKEIEKFEVCREIIPLHLLVFESDQPQLALFTDHCEC